MRAMGTQLRSVLACLLLFQAICGCGGHPVATRRPTGPSESMTIVAPPHYSRYSYHGSPDLALVVALVEAGGGPHRFDSRRLLSALTGGRPKAEVMRLKRHYGKARVDAFMQTLTFSMTDLLQLFALNHLALPQTPRVSPKDGRALVWAVYHDGIMLNGKYDCGYMMEHLMTHPIHVALMHDVEVQRGFGPRHNANFHELLTRVIVDLKNAYGPLAADPAGMSPAALAAHEATDESRSDCGPGREGADMCRNIRPLFNFEPPATDEEVRNASLQFVRKISGFTKPSHANEEAFNRAVEEITSAARGLIASLKTSATPRDREEAAARAKARSAKRFASR
jgi:hypothetical protein